ncbi:MAG TPA: hypothetical protein VF965_11415 [Candidatus Limnocylindria bacterium]
MTPDSVLEVAIAPDAALVRVSNSINRRSKRMFGVLKTESEYVGVVGGNSFEIWERQQRAVHAFGRISSRRGGSRIELRLVIPRRTRALILIFFVLYTVVALGIAVQPPEPDVSASDLAIAFLGAAALIAIFAVSARQQRTALSAFVNRLFSDLPRI